MTITTTVEVDIAEIQSAIFASHPNVVKVDNNGTSYDANGQEVVIDESKVTTALNNMEIAPPPLPVIRARATNFLEYDQMIEDGTTGDELYVVSHADYFELKEGSKPLKTNEFNAVVIEEDGVHNMYFTLDNSTLPSGA